MPGMIKSMSGKIRSDTPLDAAEKQLLNLATIPLYKILAVQSFAHYGLTDGERVRITSRRGQVEAPIRIDESLRPGLTFMTLHFQDDVATNLLTIDATDPKSGTAEFKATAIRIDRLEAAVQA